AEHAVEHSAGAEWAAMGLSVVVALIGLGLAALWYRRETAAPSRLALALPRFYRLVLNKYFVDELYFAAFIRPFVKLSEFAAAVDRWIVDGAVNVAGYSNEVLGMVLRFFQTGYVRNYALLMLAAVVVLLIFFI
ncbi:MAG: NADH-quinone oxidoreductase subunit L, partial [Acidobacteriota bacterium]